MKKTEEGGQPEDGGEEVRESLHSPHHTQLSLAVVGTETAVFDRDSKVRERILAYTRHFGEVHIVVMCGSGFSEEHIGERVHIYPTNSSSRILRIFGAWNIGRRLSQVDIVSAQDPFETGLAAFLIARPQEALLHVQVHTDFLSPAYARLSLLNRMRVLLARFVLRRAHRIRAVSERIRASLRAKYRLRAPVSVLPIFVDVERFRNAPRDQELSERFGRFAWKVLVVSRLEPEKNAALALRSFAHAAPRDACLIFVGEGREKPALEREARKLGVAERVFFEGRRDPAAYYALADIVLFPSKYDGYGMVIVEALAAGVPVLSTDVGIAREAGALVASPERFAQTLGEWFKSGVRKGVLRSYPYRSFDEYVGAYCDDVVASARRV